ncbi:membrane protein [Hirsutella rhossiliensis]|uniref:Membrane protein n=1 Tax=Hirsutella rhossiliensis TaxID=111463 RepID=A0A9P8MXC8_9HYPO|nr:uncharacterized protein HRG_04251 [Hirsutella rhossiliensis]KAH0963823.1 membrane protein [Hirsutella rhossiliensis]
MQRQRNQVHATVKAEDQESEAGEVLVLTDTENPRQSRRRRRIATVYDAVAGHVWSKQATRDEAAGWEDRARVIKHSTRHTPLAPDELLFRRKDAPERYAEHDIYNAHERDIPHGALPESNLLKAIHGYTSGFYGALARKHRPRLGGRDVDERSMDETALLAFGILLEEAGREVLGRRGDLVFTEGADEVRRDEVAREVGPEAFVGYQEAGTPWKTAKRGPKRRKVVKEDEET